MSSEERDERDPLQSLIAEILDTENRGEAVDRNFGNGCSLRVVEERVAAARCWIVVNPRRGVESPRPEAHPLRPGQLGGFCKRERPLWAAGVKDVTMLERD